MRKRILTPINAAILILSLFVVSSAIAQDTLLISYQGMLRDATGEPITGSPAITFTIYTAGGDSKWAEEHSSVPVNNGLFSVTLGSQTALPDSVFNGETRYLGIAVEGDEEIDPRTLLTSSPGAAVSRRVVGDIHTDVGELVVTNPSSYPGLVKLKVSDHYAGADIFGNADPFVMAGNLQITTDPNAAGLLMSHGSHDDSLGVELRASEAANIIRIHPPDPCVPPDSCEPAVELMASDTSASVVLTNEDASSGAITVFHSEANQTGVITGAYCLPADHSPGDPPPTGWQSQASLYVGTSAYDYWQSEDGSSAWAKRAVTSNLSTISCESRSSTGDSSVISMAASETIAKLTLLNGDQIDPPDVVVLATTDGGGQIGINTDSPVEALDVNGTVQTTGFKMPTDAADGYVLTSDADGNGTWQASASDGAESGEFDGQVSSDMVETDPGGVTTISFDSPFTSTEKPHMFIVVVLKQAANGLMEGAAIKAVVDIKGSAGNWTGFDITVSKYSDGSSISDTTKVYVIWMAIAR